MALSVYASIAIAWQPAGNTSMTAALHHYDGSRRGSTTSAGPLAEVPQLKYWQPSPPSLSRVPSVRSFPPLPVEGTVPQSWASSVHQRGASATCNCHCHRGHWSARQRVATSVRGRNVRVRYLSTGPLTGQEGISASHPLIPLWSVGILRKGVLVRVVVLAIHVPQHVEGLHSTAWHSTACPPLAASLVTASPS